MLAPVLVPVDCWSCHPSIGAPIPIRKLHLGDEAHNLRCGLSRNGISEVAIVSVCAVLVCSPFGLGVPSRSMEWACLDGPADRVERLAKALS